ncbi:hypothetical protein A9Q99_09825 [Gammaproteobacteria bacterium 45_16_T64]|nr:hypothetical protein A9Q99_09825 [Gammaproteobacteria bacterium 45_16_T64]
MVISLFFSVAANVSQATDGIICSGTISILGLHTTDKVMLKLSGMNTVVQICDLNKTLGSSNPVSAEQCKAAYSTLLTAYSLNKSLSIYFDNVGTGTSCSTFAGWEVATARWIPLTSD